MNYSDVNSLIKEMQSYGLRINSNKLVHGKIVRCPTNNKPTKKNGFVLVFFNSTFTYALYGDYQQGGDILKWNSKQRLTSAEKQQVQEHIAEYHKQRELEIQQNLRNIRNRYQQFRLLSANHCSLSHDYLIKKGIADIVNHKLAYSLKLDNYGNLVIPMLSVNSELMGYQLIAPDGNKRFAKGSVVKSGFYPIITTKLEDIAYCTSIFIGEGFATIASCYLSLNESPQNANYKTSNAYIVAYGVHMIEPVLVAIIKTFLVKNPMSNIVLVADNDAVNINPADAANTMSQVTNRVNNNIGVDVCTAIKNRYQNKYKIRVFIPQLIGGHHHD